MNGSFVHHLKEVRERRPIALEELRLHRKKLLANRARIEILPRRPQPFHERLKIVLVHDEISRMSARSGDVKIRLDPMRPGPFRTRREYQTPARLQLADR